MKAALATALAALALAVCGAASAQDTTCRRVGNELRCTTSPSAADVFSAIRERQAREAEAADRRRAKERDYEDRRDRENDAADAAYFNKHLADLVRAGKCDDAREFALRKGKLSDVETVMKVCQPATS